MNVTLITSIARHALTFGGGYLISRGVAPESVESLIGGLTTAIGLGWSFYEKKK